jgi:hypothetical protein
MSVLLALLLAAIPQSNYPVTSGKAYKFEKIADGVYYATATGRAGKPDDLQELVSTNPGPGRRHSCTTAPVSMDG